MRLTSSAQRGVAATALALSVLGSAGEAAAQAAVSTWDVSAGAMHRRLVERADDGRQLVKETGPMLRLSLAGQVNLSSGGALRGELAAAGGELDYQGRTQGGVPLNTDSRHRDLEATLAWRPFAPANWGEGWIVLRTLQQRRQIASTPTVGGLDETATLVLPGIRWVGDFQAASWRLRPSFELRTSVHHSVDVDYRGVFDAQELDGGRRDELQLGVEASAAGSPWSWSLAWTRARQKASDTDTVRRAGVAVGTVRQPRIEIDDVMLSVRRSF